MFSAGRPTSSVVITTAPGSTLRAKMVRARTISGPWKVALVSSRGERRQQRSEEHTSELQSQSNLVCRLLLEKKKKQNTTMYAGGNQLLLLPQATSNVD